MTAVQAETTRARKVLDRLNHGQDGDGRHWQLRLPSEGKPFRQARPLLLVLGLPTLGLAFAISVLTTYGPVVLIHVTQSTSKIGLLIGAEGAFALLIPLVSGVLSDRLPGSPAARRLPFVLIGAPFIVAGLVLLAFSGSYALAAASVFAFFVGYSPRRLLSLPSFGSRAVAPTRRPGTRRSRFAGCCCEAASCGHSRWQMRSGSSASAG